jgi:protein tyrosine/serine phosphatase
MSDKQTEPPKQLSVRENDKPVQSALEFLNPDWIKVYIAIAENGKDWIRKNMEIVADHDGGVLYHCMTGKDRTGLFTAMLLGLCNAYPADIIADYSVSQVNLRPFYLSMMKFPEMLDTPKNCRKPYRRGLHGVMIRVRKRISVS